MATAHDLGVKYEHIARRRTILVAVHIFFGFAAGVALIEPRFKFYHANGMGGGGTTLWHLCASWPYLVSGIKCYSGEVLSNLRLTIQVSVLALSTAIVAAIYLGAINLHWSALGLVILVLFVQFVLFSQLVVPLATPRR